MLVEICAGDLPELVWVDAEGKPADPLMPHVKCLDCLLYAAPLPGSADGLLTLASLHVTADASLPDLSPLIPLAHSRPLPRGPPAAGKTVVRAGGLRPNLLPPGLLVDPSLDSYQSWKMSLAAAGRANL
jgi:hypothetical protein